MTKLMTMSGVVYTELSVGEVRSYMQGGVKSGTIYGFEDQAGTIPIIIGVHAIEYIYE